MVWVNDKTLVITTWLFNRRIPFVGILVANVLYTFGPLHWNYFWSRSAVAVPMFAAIFAIGLFFGVLFRRSGNLWMVAVIHGGKSPRSAVEELMLRELKPEGAL